MQNFWTLNQFIKNAVRQKIVEQEMFSVELQSFMDIQRKHMSFLNVPWVVRLCSDDMIRRGLVLEGLFRVPGSHNVISSVCEAARHGLVPDFDQPDCCLEEVSGVFKKYIRELPSPLFIDDTPENKLHQEFTKVMELQSEDDQIATLNRLIKQLTPCRRALAKEIFLLFFLVSLESEINLMTSLNLGTIFGGMIDIISNTMFSDEKKRLCTLLIDHYPKIFHDIDVLKRSDPPAQMTPEELSAKAVFLDDGTFRSYWGTGGETAFSMKEAVVKKLQAVSENPLTFVELYRIFEIRDREVRLLDDDELVVPLMKEHRTLLCSNKFNIQEISIPWHISLANKRDVQFQESYKAYLAQGKAAIGAEKKPSSSSLSYENEKIERQALDNEEKEFKKMQARQQELLKKKEEVVQKQASPEVLKAVQALYEKFVKSEEEYVNNLRIFSKYYLPAFQQVKDHQLPAAEINLIFYPALSGLTSLHEQFFARLTTENIPHTLLSTMSYFKMYGQICSNQELCLETAKKLSKETKFIALTAKCKKESNSEIELLELLELPGKRMQQYCDQIFEIIKASKDEPIPFAAHIKEAYVALTKLNSDNIEQTEVSKTRATMLYLLDRIDASTFPAGFELMLPTRRFTKESENVSVKVDGVVAPAAKAEKNVLNKVIKTKKEGKLTKGIWFKNIEVKSIKEMKLVNDDSDITGQLLSINTMNDKNEKHSYLLQIKDPHTWQVFINNSLQTALALEKEKQDVLKKKEEAAHKLEEQHSKTELTQDAKPENEHVEGKLKKEKRSSGIKESIEDVDSKSTKREKKEKENLAEDSEGRITKRDRKDKPEKLDKESKSEKETTEKGDNEPVSARTPPSSSSSTPTPIVSAIPKVRPIDAITQSAPTKRHRSKSVNSSFVLTPTSSEVLDTSSTKDDAEDKSKIKPKPTRKASSLSKGDSATVSQLLRISVPDLPQIPQHKPKIDSDRKPLSAREGFLSVAAHSDSVPKSPKSARAPQHVSSSEGNANYKEEKSKNDRKGRSKSHNESSAITKSKTPREYASETPSASETTEKDSLNQQATVNQPNIENLVDDKIENHREILPALPKAPVIPTTESTTENKEPLQSDFLNTANHPQEVTQDTAELHSTNEPEPPIELNNPEIPEPTNHSQEPTMHTIEPLGETESLILSHSEETEKSEPIARKNYSSTSECLSDLGFEEFISIFEDEGWCDPNDFAAISIETLESMGFNSIHLAQWKKHFSEAI